MQIPRSITRQQYVDALKVFTEALGLDANEMFFPTILDVDRINFPALYPDKDGRKQLAHGWPLIPADEGKAYVLSVQVEIPVVG
jgi:hypothetical protein